MATCKVDTLKIYNECIYWMKEQTNLTFEESTGLHGI